MQTTAHEWARELAFRVLRNKLTLDLYDLSRLYTGAGQPATTFGRTIRCRSRGRIATVIVKVTKANCLTNPDIGPREKVNRPSVPQPKF